MSLTLERPQHKNQKKTPMSMEGERRADWGRREKRGMFCKVCAVILSLMLLASLWIEPNGLGVIQADLVEGPDLLFSVKLVGDWVRCFLHRA